MKRILSLVLAAIMLTALTPALAEDVSISYKEATIGFTVPTGYPLFEKINSSGDTHFLMIPPMDYGSGQTRVGIAEGTAEGWVEEKVEFFQNMLETDPNATYEDPQISGPTVVTLDNGLQAHVAFASAIYETALTKVFANKKIQYNYYAAIPLYSDLILTADFSHYTNADEKQLLNDECVLAVLNNLVISVPEQQATSVEAQAQTAPAPSAQGASNVQDELIEADMRDGLVLEDCRFVLANSSDSYWDSNLYLAIRNDSNKTITPKGSLQMLDADGNVIDEDNYPTCYPSELAPGEVGYVAEWNYLSKDKLPSSENLAKISISFGANEYDLNTNYTKLDIAGEMLHDVDYFDSMLRCTITNNTSEMVKGPWVVATIYDQNDRLAFAYMTMVSGGNTCYLPAGQQFVMDIPVSSTLEDWYSKNGIELKTVKLLCYSQN